MTIAIFHFGLLITNSLLFLHEQDPDVPTYEKIGNKELREKAELIKQEFEQTYTPEIIQKTNLKYIVLAKTEDSHGWISKTNKNLTVIGNKIKVIKSVTDVKVMF